VDANDFVAWYGPWSPLNVAGVAKLLNGFLRPWWIVGGYAIERFSGVHRDHEDIDVAILRSDAPQLLQILSDQYHAWANASGTLTPMLDDRAELPSNAVQIWIRRDAQAPWAADFVISEERDGKWVWRHDAAVTMSLDELTWVDDDGVRFSRPEVVLAHKAKWRQSKDDLDFDATWPLLNSTARTWLRTTTRTLYPDHTWLAHMH